MLRKFRTRSTELSFGPGNFTLALAGQSQGHLHVGAAVTTSGDFIVDGATFAHDPCLAPEVSGCVIASKVRILRRALSVLDQSASTIIITEHAAFAELLRSWIDGSVTAPPEWYQDAKPSNSFTTVINTLRALHGYVDVRLVTANDVEMRYIGVASALASTALTAMINPDSTHEWGVTRCHELVAAMVAG